MCEALGVTRSGYYAWLHNPISNRAEEDARLLRLIRASFKASQGIYGSPRVFLDLREAGETCSKHRVARLMRVNKIKAFHGYRTRHYSVGKAAVIAPDLVKRNFDVIRPNKVWVTLHSHLAGVALPGGRDGPVLKVDHWLGHRAEPAPGARAGCRNDGCAAPASERHCDPL